jgi:hypothetical protein
VGRARPDVHSPGLDWFLDQLPPARASSSSAAATAARPTADDRPRLRGAPDDGTAAMAQLASEAARRVAVPVMRFDELDAVEAFDGVWSQAALLHVPESDLPRCSPRVHRALKPGGYHWASYKDGTGGGRDALGRFFSYIALDRLEPPIAPPRRGRARAAQPRGIPGGLAGHDLARGARAQVGPKPIARSAAPFY